MTVHARPTQIMARTSSEQGQPAATARITWGELAAVAAFAIAINGMTLFLGDMHLRSLAGGAAIGLFVAMLAIRIDPRVIARRS